MTQFKKSQRRDNQFELGLLDSKFKSKFATLAPYIAEIQRRKKLRSITKKSKRNLADSSSKSFRIKEKSATSLHRDAFLKNRQTAGTTIISKVLEGRDNRQRKARSVQRTHEFQISKTIDHNLHQTQKPNNTFFNELYVRVKSKIEKEKPIRKKLYETLEENRAKSQQAGDMNMYKIGIESIHSAYTNFTNIPTQNKKESPEPIQIKKNDRKKGNFRRNKYEVLHSSVAQNQIPKPAEKDHIQSDSRIELDKKESNVSINRQMDILAERQMETFYHQIRNKELNRNIEKSTEKYFKYESYRQTKSKNDIQVFISTIKNPSLHKISKSTNDNSDSIKQAFQPHPIKNNNNDLFDYDFDFKIDEENRFGQINEIDNPSQEESSLQINPSHHQFEDQRKRVQADFFHKVPPELDWSEDDCKVDEI